MTFDFCIICNFCRTSFFRGTLKISDPFRGQILGQIQTKVLRVFLVAIHSHLDSFALRFLFLQTPATSYRFFSSVTVHCKGERKKTWQKIIPPSLWFKKSLQKPQVWELSRLCPEISPKRNVTPLRKGYPRSPLPPSQLRWSRYSPPFRATIYTDKHFFISDLKNGIKIGEYRGFGNPGLKRLY